MREIRPSGSVGGLVEQSPSLPGPHWLANLVVYSSFSMACTTLDAVY